LDVVIFQVSYQMKILTTAACSVAMLGRRLSTGKWLSLFLLALGVAIVQIQTTNPHKTTSLDTTEEAAGGSSHHTMHHLKGIMAVIMACFTSGLAGVYFEMVLKGSKADLWIRNIQLSLFSLIPALVPILFGPLPIRRMFDGFGFWAWSTVATQVAGGLITALVIKFSDNIIKGFATSISIVLSFLASVILFNFRITPAFVIGATTVMIATWMYNQPQPAPDNDVYSRNGRSSFPGSPHFPSTPILGQFSDKKRASLVDLSPRTVAAALGLSASSEDLMINRPNHSQSSHYNSALAAHSIHSNVSSRAPSPPLPREQESQGQEGNTTQLR
jgi:UDP-sugar transporter A1/2/3